jgi:hypothetical protein
MGAEFRTCEHCGSRNPAGAEACRRCGQPLGLPAVPEGSRPARHEVRLSRAAALLIILGASAIPLGALAVYVTLHPPGPSQPPSPQMPVLGAETLPGSSHPASEEAYIGGATSIWAHACDALRRLSGVVEVGNLPEVAETAERLRIEFDGMRIKARDLSVPSSLANVHYEFLTALERSSRLCEEARVVSTEPMDEMTRVAQEAVMREAADNAQAAYAAVQTALPEVAPDSPPNLVGLADMIARLADRAPSEPTTGPAPTTEGDAGAAGR